MQEVSQRGGHQRVDQGFCFVGDRGQWDKIKGTIYCKEIAARFKLVIKYLRALKAVNPAFADIEIDDSPAMEATLKDLHASFLDSAIIISDDLSIAIEKAATSDTAAVRWSFDQVSERDEAEIPELQSQQQHDDDDDDDDGKLKAGAIHVVKRRCDGNRWYTIRIEWE